MALFSTDFDQTFDVAWFEQQSKPQKKKKRRPRHDEADESVEQDVFAANRPAENETDKTQFTIFQLDDGDKRLLNTTEIKPKLQGAPEKPDVNLSLDFESFRLNANDRPESKDRATLQLSMGQEKRLNTYDKLFYCINGGLDLWNQYNHKGKANPDEFRQSADVAMGNKPISLPGGQGKLTFNVVKHNEPEWWQRIFSFAGSSAGKQLLSLVGFGGITEAAFKQIGSMLEMLFDKHETETLFSSHPIKIAFTQSARDDIGGGLSVNRVSCLNSGFWVLARVNDYTEIIDQKPIYYPGYGILAPEGLEETGIHDSASNPFFGITYAVIRARIKETSLKQDV